MVSVVLYYEANCHACEQARQLVAKGQALFHYQRESYQIGPGVPAWERYDQRVPVVFINENQLFSRRLPKDKFFQAIEKALARESDAGINDVRKALIESNRDMEKAMGILRKKVITKIDKLDARAASQELIGSYVNMGGKIGVLIEVNCETDFVARNDDFQSLVKDLAMQVAASSPAFVSREDVPQDIIDKERAILAAQLDVVTKPEPARGNMVEGRLNKFFAARCLMEQPFIKEPKITVREFVSQRSGKLGERIIVHRFTRFALGEIEKHGMGGDG